MMTITIVILFTFLMTGQIELLYIGLASLLVLMLSIIMSLENYLKATLKILKGDET